MYRRHSVSVILNLVHCIVGLNLNQLNRRMFKIISKYRMYNTICFIENLKIKENSKNVSTRTYTEDEALPLEKRFCHLILFYRNKGR